MEEEVRETQKKYCSRAMVAAIVGGLILILAGQKGLGKGLVLGTIFSVVNFIAMGMMLPLVIGKTKGPAIASALMTKGLRFGLLAIPLVIAVKFDQIDIITTVIGVFMIQLVIVLDHIRQFFSPSHKHPN